MSVRRRFSSSATLCFAIALGACSGPPPAAPAAPLTAQAPVPPTKSHAALQLLVDTSSCWLGGMWGDVQGETRAEREVSSQQRCEGVVRTVFGRNDHERYVQLRAFEPTALAQVKIEIGALAKADPADAPNAATLGKMFTALADAQYETMLARRASTRIKRDLAREPERLSDDETAALRQLEASTSFNALFQLDAGVLQHEAQTLMLLVMLDRMRVAEELPVHLKPYAVVIPLHAVFDAPIPDLPHDASKPLVRGGWLAYLTSAAAAAGHPVTDPNRPPEVRHEAAVAGIMEGIADRLRTNLPGIGVDTPLAKVTILTIRALEQSRDRVGP